MFFCCCGVLWGEPGWTRGEHANSTQKGPGTSPDMLHDAGLEPTTFLLWGNSATHWATVPPVCVCVWGWWLVEPVCLDWSHVLQMCSLTQPQSVSSQPDSGQVRLLKPATNHTHTHTPHIGYNASHRQLWRPNGPNRVIWMAHCYVL